METGPRVATIDHAVPFQGSISVLPNESPPVDCLSTATQSEGPTHVTASRALSWVRFGLGTTAQVVASQRSVRLVSVLVEPTAKQFAFAVHFIARSTFPVVDDAALVSGSIEWSG